MTKQFSDKERPVKVLSRKSFLAAMGAGGTMLALAACQQAAPTQAPAAEAPTAEQPAATEAPAAAQPAPTEAPTAEQPAPTPAPAAEGVTITVSSWWNQPFRVLLPKFNEKYPEITVEIIDEEFSAHHDKLLTALVAGTGAVDVAGCEDSRVSLMANTGGLADLTDLMAPYEDKVVPYKLNLAKYQGKNVAVSWDGSPCLLYYRRDICKEYGIEPEKLVTYDDYYAAGMKLKDATDGKVKLIGTILQDAINPWLINWMWQQGGGIVNLDDNKVTCDSPEGVTALTYLKKLWDDGLVHQSLAWDAQLVTCKDGTSAIFPGAIWYAASIKGPAPETEGLWGVVKLPTFTNGGSQATIWGGSTIVIPAQGKHIPEAFKFAEFNLLTQEGAESGWTNGDLFPVLIDAVNWPIMSEPVKFYGDQPALKLYAEANAEVPPLAYGKDWLETSRILGQQQSECLLGNKTPEQALADAATEIRGTFGLE
jgi:lactose/L-arabinose transport system substrate-binding protein